MVLDNSLFSLLQSKLPAFLVSFFNLSVSMAEMLPSQQPMEERRTTAMIDWSKISSIVMHIIGGSEWKQSRLQLLLSTAELLAPEFSRLSTVTPKY